MLKINEEDEIDVLGARTENDWVDDWRLGLTEGEKMKTNTKEEREYEKRNWRIFQMRSFENNMWER